MFVRCFDSIQLLLDLGVQDVYSLCSSTASCAFSKEFKPRDLNAADHSKPQIPATYSGEVEPVTPTANHMRGTNRGRCPLHQ